MRTILDCKRLLIEDIEALPVVFSSVDFLSRDLSCTSTRRYSDSRTLATHLIVNLQLALLNLLFDH